MSKSNCSKIGKDEAAELIREAERYADVADKTIRELPRTPGRDEAEEGFRQVRKGIDRIKREAEIGERTR